MIPGGGIGKAVGMALFVGLFWIGAKIILNKYPVSGLTELANAL